MGLLLKLCPGDGSSTTLHPVEPTHNPDIGCIPDIIDVFIVKDIEQLASSTSSLPKHFSINKPLPAEHIRPPPFNFGMGRE